MTTLERFGPYLLLRPLAEGGMGALSLAYDPARDGIIVLKRPGARVNAELRARFLDEAETTRRLIHPCLVEFIGAGTVAGEPYLALGYVPGRDLHTLCLRLWQRESRLPLGVVLHVGRQLCQGLRYAHEVPGLAFVHRDVTPTNVLVGFDGTMRLADHGLSWRQGKRYRTVPGVAAGTVGFASPEQLAAGPIDQRTDVYGVGAVLWFMLTGRSPRDPVDPSRSLVEQQALARFAPDLPANVEALIYRALASEPSARFPTVAALGAALEAASGPEAPLDRLMAQAFPGDEQALRDELSTLLHDARLASSTPAQAQTSRARWIALGLIAAASLIAYGWPRHPPPTVVTRTPADPPPVSAPASPPTATSPPEAVEPSPPAPSPQERFSARLAAARALARRGMLARAAAQYDELERAGAPRALVLLGRGELALMRGDDEAAIRAATEARALGGGAEAARLLARAHAHAAAP